MLAISATDAWRAAHPGAAIGLLELSGVADSGESGRLADRKRETEARLRDRYQGLTRQDLTSLPMMAAYVRYYKRFNKTYHVQLQLESIVLKGKSLPSVSPLVDANFAAEVDTLVLTAGHDATKLEGAVSLDVSRDGDEMTRMNGNLTPLRPGDMIMRDARGVCCSIIYGQDNRSPISRESSHVLYVAYAPAGVPAAAVEAQLQAIEDNVRLVSARFVVEQRRVLAA
ncbi:MAG TPA: phenylalanine--tRNA ligase beta subunit-related protein [Methylomirabilota bacterium]|nr:phenylalanine--tRNA ligase beta subunit-related protein [Methylomirabilota bacterium]